MRLRAHSAAIHSHHILWLKLWLIYLRMLTGWVVMLGVGRDKSAFIRLKGSFFSPYFEVSLFFSLGGFSLYSGKGAK